MTPIDMTVQGAAVRRRAQGRHPHALRHRVRADVHVDPRPAPSSVDADAGLCARRRQLRELPLPQPLPRDRPGPSRSAATTRSSARSRASRGSTASRPTARARLLLDGRGDPERPRLEGDGLLGRARRGGFPAHRDPVPRRLALGLRLGHRSRTRSCPGSSGPEPDPDAHQRRDYVENGNDSHWLSNPEQPLTGFARVIGDERTARSLRTRLGLTMIAGAARGHGRPAAARGSPCTTWRRWRWATASTRASCGATSSWTSATRTRPVTVSSAGPVDVSAACPMLARWDLATTSTRPARSSSAGSPRTLFSARTTTAADRDLKRAVRRARTRSSPTRSTPRPGQHARAASTPTTRSSAGRSPTPCNDLRSARTSRSTAPCAGYQYDTRGGKRIPIHGGPGDARRLQRDQLPWEPRSGYPDVTHGSASSPRWASAAARCPVRQYTFVTYSESENPSSPHNSDYTRAFSRKRWEPEPFCAGQVRREATSTERVSAR